MQPLPLIKKRNSRYLFLRHLNKIEETVLEGLAVLVASMFNQSRRPSCLEKGCSAHNALDIFRRFVLHGNEYEY